MMLIILHVQAGAEGPRGAKGDKGGGGDHDRGGDDEGTKEQILKSLSLVAFYTQYTRR